MKVSKKEHQVLLSSLSDWRQREIIDAKQQKQMQDSLEPKLFDWQLLAKFTFWGGVGCLVLALWAVVLDEKLMLLLEHLFNTPPIIKSIFLVVIAGVFWCWGVLIRRKKPGRIFSYDPIFFLGVISIAFSVLFLGEALNTGSGHFSILILIPTVIYFLAGWLMRSGLIWLCALTAAGIWYGFETDYISGESELFVGMNLPVRYLPFGVLIWLGGFLVQRRFDGAKTLTQVVGLGCFFFALWLTTFYGNGEWYPKTGEFEHLPWSILLLVVSVLSIYTGAKRKDDRLREFGVVFVLVNIYSRYFEYLWNEMHTSLFLTVMAASLWLVGKYAERLWLLGK